MTKNNALFKQLFAEKYLSRSALKNIQNDIQSLKLDIKKYKKSNAQSKKISIIIPTHNRLDALTKLLSSIFSQKYQNFEIIIVDDVSTDDTQKFFSNLKDPRIKYIRNKKNLGMGLNRQKAYNYTSGEYIIFSDDDDYYIDDEYFAKAVQIFKDNSINMICSSSIILQEDVHTYEPFILNFSGKIKAIDYLKRFQFDLRKPTSTFPLILRKSALEKTNFKDMKMMNDSSIYLRALLANGHVYANKKIIGVYRIHSANDTKNVKVDFIIKNLREKQYVYKQLKKVSHNFNLFEWYEEQIKITAHHYLNGTKESKFKKNKLLIWVLLHVSRKTYNELKNYSH